MTLSRAFDQITRNDIGIVGGKGANLGEMTAAGLPVPPGFCLTADAYRQFISGAGLDSQIEAILAAMRIDDPADVDAKAAQIRALITGAPMPPEIAAEAVANYRRLSIQLDPHGDSIAVAVRSSATAEDLPGASFAGQQDTYLNVRGEDDLLENVRRCWASLWTARAVTYRVKQGFDHKLVALAVVVQAMIRSEVSGILFTANPVSGRRGEALINASWGLGEAIVSGMVTPDTYIVNKRDGAILSRMIASKELSVEYAPDGRGTVERAVPAEQRRKPALNDAQISQLGVLCATIERHYGAPMDIEWAFARGQCTILQARPITTLKDAPAAVPGDFNRTMFIEIFAEPISPIFVSVICPLFHSMLDFTFGALGFKPAKGVQAIGAFYGQPYFNQRYIEAALAPLSPSVRERLVAQIVNPFGKHQVGFKGEVTPRFLGMGLRLLGFMRGFPAQLPNLIKSYRTDIAAIEAQEIDNLPDTEIVKQVRRLLFTTGREFLSYDFLMIALIGITYQAMSEMLVRYFGAESDTVRSRLVSGVTGNVTMETNKALWDLAQMAKASPAARAALAAPDYAAFRAQLEHSADGVRFRRALDQFLHTYGHREVRMDIIYPTWSEDPSPVLAFLRGYLDLDEERSPHRQQERLVRERHALIDRVHDRMRTDLRGRLIDWPIFNTILQQVQMHTRERDTMHFELTRLFPPFRRMLGELGNRWTAKGLLTQPDDIYYLTFDEIESTPAKPQDWRAVAAARRGEHQRNCKRHAPPIIRDGEEMLAESEAAPVPDGAVGGFRGTAGSPGRASGIVRVVLGPEEFGKLGKGDILVAPLTNPVWTPLFAIASGIITEVGGILSHGAIVAREYGIPAVMAVSGATTRLTDGQHVTVDGDTGIVTLIEDGATAAVTT
ncbi:MAG: hypothetical protein HZB53_07800 [Chloroflexi bacterium]|nr:hypothetical protein [Chloroflexota bacterium]